MNIAAIRPPVGVLVVAIAAVLLVMASCSGPGKHRGLNLHNKHVVCYWVQTATIGSAPHRVCVFVNPSPNK